ncbi:MAG TPA: EAL domain-containing protein [Burkholderiaceae bacterium]|nr:EAL domain-containing protein [Burkholderiaceae bacterium]
MRKQSPVRLLLVEDNAGDARLFREMLKEQNAHVIEVTHVQRMSEAEQHLAEHAVDIILLDLGLPDAQGLEAIRRIRSAAPRIPVVMLTILDDELLAAKALQSGAQDYLIKGQTNSRELLRSLQYAIDRNISQNDLRESERRFSALLEAQKEAERRIKSLNRVHAVLSGISALTVRVRDREELFREACRVAVEDGGFVMAWIGVVNREAGLIKRVACAGDVRNFFETAPVTVFESKAQGAGYANRAIVEMKPVISQNVKTDGRAMVGSGLVDKGINSLAFIPLVVSSEAIGVLGLYAADTEGFSDDEEMKLLVELADNISIGLEHIQKTERLNYLAYYDPLTSLANRALFLDRTAQMLLAEGDPARKVAVFALDIERFKTVNEALGRQAGDELLKKVADRLRQVGPGKAPFEGIAGDRFSALRARSHLGRVAADQFAIVSTEAQNDEQFAHLTEAMLTQCFGVPFRIGDSDVRISAKVGIAVFPTDGMDAETLLSHATAAVRKAKASGEHYSFYAQEMNERSTAMLALENKLRQAYEREEFVLHYQPKIDLESRCIVGVEALIRWQSPEQGLVPPIKFISLMEETGLILEVGAWALSKAVADHLRWVEMCLPAPRVAVNVSAIQLRKKDFVKTLVEAATRGTTAPGIDLEITESLVMEDIEGNIAKLREVRALGLSIAIDDFGTGYSSLAYLAKLPVQTLKIDRSFVNTMLDDPDTLTMVQTIISLAHSLRLKVVAEGVESEEQVKMLRLLHCDAMQGYLFSKAVPFDALTSLLNQAKNDMAVFAASRAVLA